ncbi:MAG: protoheme IX farnesyltransferase [Bacteroidetes bacterium]|nr:MAG: protoheme IX farnesyltransferase [Bacteroidota bacterium]MBL1143331.1 protoheme IX farnesyltransferase [Bacteroidota bacterium]NOG56133.1 protoheme IX farnesyltransferase [Bacteroidota bacterium]
MDLIQENELSITGLITDKLRSYAAFFKLRLASLVVFSAAFGYLIAADTIDWQSFIWLSIGGFLVTGASNGYNQMIEVDLDKLMDRTKKRPLVTKKMSKPEAFIVATLSAIVGVAILWFFLNPLSGILGLFALFMYVLLYTPLKRITPWAVFVGAFPGAIPPMLGYIAYTGKFGLEAGLLFALQFMWQFPHFWAIAWKVDQDYKKAGFYLLPSKGGKDKSSAFLILIYTLFMIMVSLLPMAFRLTGPISSVFFLLGGLLMLIPSIKLFKDKSDKAATKVMFASFIYVPIVLVAWYFDKI